MKRILVAAAITLVASSAFAAISGSKHDLSSGGSNTYKGGSDQLCIYCHTPHNAQGNGALLWNRTNGAVAVTVYNKSVSSTLNYKSDRSHVVL